MERRVRGRAHEGRRTRRPSRGDSRAQVGRRRCAAARDRAEGGGGAKREEGREREGIRRAGDEAPRRRRWRRDYGSQLDAWCSPGAGRGAKSGGARPTRNAAPAEGSRSVRARRRGGARRRRRGPHRNRRGGPRRAAVSMSASIHGRAAATTQRRGGGASGGSRPGGPRRRAAARAGAAAACRSDSRRRSRLLIAILGPLPDALRRGPLGMRIARGFLPDPGVPLASIRARVPEPGGRAHGGDAALVRDHRRARSLLSESGAAAGTRRPPQHDEGLGADEARPIETGRSARVARVRQAVRPPSRAGGGDVVRGAACEDARALAAARRVARAHLRRQESAFARRARAPKRRPRRHRGGDCRAPRAITRRGRAHVQGDAHGAARTTPLLARSRADRGG